MPLPAHGEGWVGLPFPVQHRNCLSAAPFQVGFGERALACFQALIEYNCFAPDKLGPRDMRSKRNAFFEIFWDADVPKFGEPGWC